MNDQCPHCGLPRGHTADCTSEAPYDPPVFIDLFMHLDLRLSKVARTRQSIQAWLDMNERMRKEKHGNHH